MSESDARSNRKAILTDVIAAAAKTARRLSWSIERLDHVMPLGADRLDTLSDRDQEGLDALLLRFASLVVGLQDGVGRSILEVEEENLSDKSRKDQRLLLEKLGALDPLLEFGEMAELRNKISHRYPDDLAKQTAILNDVFARAYDALRSFNGLRAFADERHFGGTLFVPAVDIPKRLSDASRP